MQAPSAARSSSLAPSPPSPVTVYLLRHSETEFSSESGGKIGGWIDVPLTDRGVRIAHAVARVMAKRNIAYLISSSSRSATETASIFGTTLGLPVEVDPNLRSWNLGELSGKAHDAVWGKVVDYINHPDTAPTRGESFTRYRDRVLDALETHLGYAEARQEDTLIITHSRNLRLFEAWYKAGMEEDDLYLPIMTQKQEKPPIGPLEGVVVTATDDGWKRIAF